MKTINQTLRLLAIVFFLPTLLKAQSISDKADSLLKEYYRQDLFTGTVLIAKGGDIVFEKSYGMANRENGVPNTSVTQYRIGSLSKPLTALIILQLRDKGLLRLNEPVSKYFPDFPKADSVTIENLLNHTSGIRSLTSTNRYRLNRQDIKGQEDVLTILKAEPFAFSPGSSWQYSNSNYMLLSYIAEKITGKTMSQLVKDLAGNLEMKNTGMDYDGRNAAAKAIGYEAQALKDYMPVEDNNIMLITGAGGVYSTAADLLKFDRALYKNAILSDSTKKQMFTGGRGDYGYGWETGVYKGRKELGHSGSIEGFKSVLLRYPESETCIIFLSNYWNTRGPEICEGLKAIAFEEPFKMPASRNYISLPAGELKAYEGEYSFNGVMTMTIKAEEGQLLSLIQGQPVVAFKPVSAFEFYNKSNNALINFEKDGHGSFGVFRLVKGKQAMEWKRKTAAQ